MARAFGKILSRIWDDSDFLALEIGPQRLYAFLVSQSNLNYAGLLPLTLRKWSKKAKDLTLAVLEEHLEALAAARFVLIDEDTEELLIRTYVRNDDIWKQPRMMSAMVSGAQEIESHRLRRALLVEVDRIPVDELSDDPTRGRDGQPGPSIRTQVQEHIRALHTAFVGLRPAAETPSSGPGSGPGPGPDVTLLAGPASGPVAGVQAGPAAGPEGGPDLPPTAGPDPGPGSGGTPGGGPGPYARGRGPADPRNTPSPAPTPGPTPSPPTNPPPYPPPADDSPAEPHLSGRSDGEEIDPNHADALTVVGSLPPELRPSRGSADRLLAAVTELLRLGWPADDLRARMTREPPEEIHNLAAFLMQRLPPPIPYQPPAPPAAPNHVLTSGRQMCPAHPYIELTSTGTCTSCAGDARAAAADDLDQRPPVAGRPERPTPPDDEFATRAEAAAARSVLHGLEDREDWFERARKHLAELGDHSPSIHAVTITAAQLYRAADVDQPPDPDPEEV